jgi:hypothetical protein
VTLIVVGAYYDVNTIGDFVSSVLVFAKTSSTWTQTARLLASGGVQGDQFGIAVSISNDATTIAVGANWVDNGPENSGAAYLFHRSSTTVNTWTQIGKFLAANPATNDYLGQSIAMEDSIMLVGSPGVESFAGTVYVVDATLDAAVIRGPK